MMMMMMVIVIPSVTEWQLRKACLSILYEHFSKCWYSCVLLGSRGMLRSVDTDFRVNLSVPSSTTCLTLEDGTKSQCNLFYVHGLVDND